MTTTLTWEDAVLWLRAQHDRQELVRACYYDDPLEAAAERFHRSEEWHATRALLGGHLPGRVLDLGAGRGVASFAFARDGCKVTALEPDPGLIVGRAAIESLCETTGLAIETVGGWGESLPFDDGRFDVVYGRAVLHHAVNLPDLCREIARVLRPGGVSLFVREHVISRNEELPTFLDGHPLHSLYGGENAYMLAEYQGALRDAGLCLRRVIGPLENPVNYFPATRAEIDESITHQVARKLRGARRWKLPLARMILRVPACRTLLTRWASQQVDTPGRHFAFLGVKP